MNWRVKSRWWIGDKAKGQDATAMPLFGLGNLLYECTTITRDQKTKVIALPRLLQSYSIGELQSSISPFFNLSLSLLTHTHTPISYRGLRPLIPGGVFIFIHSRIKIHFTSRYIFNTKWKDQIVPYTLWRDIAAAL